MDATVTVTWEGGRSRATMSVACPTSPPTSSSSYSNRTSPLTSTTQSCRRHRKVGPWAGSGSSWRKSVDLAGPRGARDRVGHLSGLIVDRGPACPLFRLHAPQADMKDCEGLRESDAEDERELRNVRGEQCPDGPEVNF